MAITKAEQEFRSSPDLIIIIVKANSTQIYQAIKQALDIRQGIASQVMVAEKVFKDRGLQQYLANISMKVRNSPDPYRRLLMKILRSMRSLVERIGQLSSRYSSVLGGC
jgi:hypothetical protein